MTAYLISSKYMTTDSAINQHTGKFKDLSTCSLRGLLIESFNIYVVLDYPQIFRTHN